MCRNGALSAAEQHVCISLYWSKIRGVERWRWNRKQSDRKGTEETLPIALIMASCSSRGWWNHLLPEVLPDTLALNFGEFYFSQWALESLFLALLLFGCLASPSLPHFKFCSRSIWCLHSFAVLATRGCSSIAQARKFNTINANSPVMWYQQKHNFLFITLLLCRHSPRGGIFCFILFSNVEIEACYNGSI